jgi:hypothetical protein
MYSAKRALTLAFSLPRIAFPGHTLQRLYLPATWRSDTPQKYLRSLTAERPVDLMICLSIVKIFSQISPGNAQDRSAAIRSRSILTRPSGRVLTIIHHHNSIQPQRCRQNSDCRFGLATLQTDGAQANHRHVMVWSRFASVVLSFD